MRLEGSDDLVRWFAHRDEQHPETPDDLRALATAVAEAFAEGPEAWHALPGLIKEALGNRGYRWNGIYALDESGDLMLGPAAGPPVCNHLPKQGGLFQSGMCHDGILLNQTLHASDVKRWPGYVSCDAESGLVTREGLVSPVRDASGRPIAVWDLDATEPLHPADPAWFDALLATLSAAVPTTAAALLTPPQ